MPGRRTGFQPVHWEMTGNPAFCGERRHQMVFFRDYFEILYSLSIMGEARQKRSMSCRMIVSRPRLEAKKKAIQVGGLLQRVWFRVVVGLILEQLPCQALGSPISL